MNTTAQCVVLLLCVAFCTSNVIRTCRCISTRLTVDHNQVADIEEYGIRPYCNKHEVIVTMSDQTQWCLNPTKKFTIILLRSHKKKAKRAALMKATTTAPGTESATELATVVATSSSS